MATYDSLIDRTDAGALIPEQVSTEIIKAVTETSAVLAMARRLQDMSVKQFRIPVLSVLPTAAFLTGDTSLKTTSEVNWENVYVYAEELAVLVPVPEAVMADAAFDIMGEIQPALVEAFGKAIDQAVLYGTGKPSSWPSGLVTQATTASHVVSVAAKTDLYEAIMAETGTLGLIEADGYVATGHIAHMSMRGKMRNLRDSQKQPIFNRTPQSRFGYDLDGVPCTFPRNGSVDSTQSLMISGDWSQLVYSMRQDITWKILSEGVIQDASGNIVYNLAQQDMVALRAVMRLGWQLPNPANRLNATKATRLPFSVLTA